LCAWDRQIFEQHVTYSIAWHLSKVGTSLWPSQVQRNLPLTNGGLLEVHLDANQRAVVDCKFAAIPVVHGQEEI
jgi:hypothetical protein